MKLKQILNEAKQVGIIYHFTRVENAINILENDLLKATFSSKNIKGKTVSTTRDKNFVNTRQDNLSISGGDIAFKLNGNKLSNKYQVMPYDDTYDQAEKDYDYIDKESWGDEQEEIWYGKALNGDNGFKNIKKYIIEIIISKKFLNLVINGRYLFRNSDVNFEKTFPHIIKNKEQGLKNAQDIVKWFKDTGIPVKVE